MGKVNYRPKKNQGKYEARKESIIQQDTKTTYDEEELQFKEAHEEEIKSNLDETPKIPVVSNKKNQSKLDNIKVIGDLECTYHVYIEDYAYTYIYQLAATDLTKEISAALIGEIFADSKEVIVRAVIPVDMDKLSEEAEWIDMNVMEEVENQRKSYFADQNIIGWMHMQPGYGTMLTMKELREHQSVFEGCGTVCMLVDAINKIETIFVYEEDELREQSGYCMYYERNEEMQQFMLDHPSVSGVKEEMKDNVVNQFREIGKIRKAEYTQRKNLNLTVMAASIILIALTAVIVKMNDNKSYVDVLSGDMEKAKSNTLAFIEDEKNENTLEDNKALQEQLMQTKNDAVGLEKTESIDANGEKAEQNNEIESQSENLVITNENEEDSNKEVADDGKSESDYTIYKVEGGDTLADICYKQYGSAKRSVEVAKLNGLTNTNQLFVGQELKMPK